MPLPTPDDTWLQWALGLWAACTSAVFAHLYSRVEKVREGASAGSAGQFRTLWNALERIRQDMATDRKELVTRAELDRQIDRIIAEVRQRRQGHQSPDR